MNNRLEQYISELQRGLQDLSEARRVEELVEIRQHLEASVKAYQGFGMDEAAATEEAIQQFGAVRKISGGLKRAYWREKVFVPDTVLGAAILAVASSLVIGGILNPLTDLVRVATLGASRLYNVDDFVSAFAFLVPASLLSGIMVGWLAPRNGVKGTLIAKCVFGAYTLLLSALRSAIYSLQPHPGIQGGINWLTLSYGVGFMVGSLVVSVAGAYIGRHYAQKTLDRA